MFEEVFGSSELTAGRVAMAIATYERTLLPNQSPYDLFFDGDFDALTTNQVLGLNAFRSSLCSSCHIGAQFTDNTFRNIGMRPVAEDPGRMNFTGMTSDRGKFKVPSLRLVVLTPPYFHDGRIEKLDETIRSMGKYQLGRQIPDQDIASIIHFLYTLPGIYQGKSLEPVKQGQE